MGSIGFWIFYCICFGILGGGLYTYLAGKKEGRWVRFIKSAVVYTLFALLFVWLVFKLI